MSSSWDKKRIGCRPAHFSGIMGFFKSQTILVCMIFILLYNSGLELLSSVGKKERRHPSIQNDAKRRKKSVDKIMLDLAIHQPALLSHSKLNRGRPDIVHLCLLQYLFSTSVRQDHKDFSMIVHAVDNKYFEVPHSWKPPAHYLRFRGLMEQLLDKGKLKISEKGRVNLKTGSVADILTTIEAQTSSQPKLLVLSSHGQSHSKLELSTKLLSQQKQENPLVVLIGGFQQGGMPPHIQEQIQSYPAESWALPGGRLPSWKVVNDLLSCYECGLNNSESR